MFPSINKNEGFFNDKDREILKENNILKIKQLVNKTKTNLKTIGLLGYQISEIEIKLQLVGYDLKGNH